MDEKSIEAAIDAGLDVWQCGKSIDDGIRAAIAAYRDAEIDRLTTLCATLQQQAEIHAMEARGANASLAECYRAVTGGTGEPGNWHGARPVVNEIADLRAKLEAAERGRDVALESHRHVEGLLKEAEQRAELHSAAWRALGHMLGRFPELSKEIIDAARGGERG